MRGKPHRGQRPKIRHGDWPMPWLACHMAGSAGGQRRTWLDSWPRSSTGHKTLEARVRRPSQQGAPQCKPPFTRSLPPPPALLPRRNPVCASCERQSTCCLRRAPSPSNPPPPLHSIALLRCISLLHFLPLAPSLRTYIQFFIFLFYFVFCCETSLHFNISL